MNNYVICTVARSGKSWIAETLYMLGLGYGDEVLTHFAQNRAPGQERLRAAFDSEGMAGLAQAFAKVRVEEGHPCVAATLQFTNFETVETKRQAGELAAFIEALSPCVVFFLRRRDVLSQAISHFLMMESGYYHSTSPQACRPQRASVRYDRSQIDQYLAFTQRGYAGWIKLFKSVGVVPEVLEYENFIDDPKGNFTSLAERILGGSHNVTPRGDGPNRLGWENGYSIFGFSDLDPESIMAAASCQSKISDETDKAFRALYLAEQSGN